MLHRSARSARQAGTADVGADVGTEPMAAGETAASRRARSAEREIAAAEAVMQRRSCRRPGHRGPVTEGGHPCGTRGAFGIRSASRQRWIKYGDALR